MPGATHRTNGAATQTDERVFPPVGHPEAGERSAVIYTLLGSCRRHGINPFDYLKDLFTRLPAAKIARIKAFTPAAWAKRKMLAVAASAKHLLT
jgi:hypothetical protein